MVVLGVGEEIVSVVQINQRESVGHKPIGRTTPLLLKSHKDHHQIEGEIKIGNRNAINVVSGGETAEVGIQRINWNPTVVRLYQRFHRD